MSIDGIIYRLKTAHETGKTYVRKEMRSVDAEWGYIPPERQYTGKPFWDGFIDGFYILFIVPNLGFEYCKGAAKEMFRKDNNIPPPKNQ